MLNSIFDKMGSNIITIIICSLTSIILGLIIAYTHKKTSKYSKNFLITLTVMPLLVASVILMVNGNLGTSIAVLGAFSLVKFRSIPGTSKEILSIFFAMSIGLAMGMGQIFFAILITIITSTIILLLSKISIFNQDEKERILKITISEDMDYNDVFNDIFKKYLSSYCLEKVKLVNMGSLYELTYKIKLIPSVNDKNFLDDLRIKNGNLKIVLNHKLEETEF